MIVNNGSTDGTKEWIDSLPDTILRIHQENLGGAGGFYAGQKYGYDNCYDWVWMMDDDGVPEKDQLNQLIFACEKYHKKAANPLVVNVSQPDILSLTSEPISKYQTTEITCDVTCPFNGTFLHRDAMATAGLIKKEMFIYGDEVEYRKRLEVNGYQLVTVTHAIHHHPHIRSNYAFAIPGINILKIKLKPKHFSNFFYRNLGYFNHTYASKKVVFVDAIAYILFFLRKLQWIELKKFCKFYRRGIKNDFS